MRLASPRGDARIVTAINRKGCRMKLPGSNRTFLIYLLTVALATPAGTMGCYKNLEIPKEQLTDRTYLAPKERVSYVVEPKNGEAPLELKSVTVDNQTLIGQMGKNQVTIPLANVKSVEKQEFSLGRTLLGVAGFIGIGLGIFMGVMVISMPKSS